MSKKVFLTKKQFAAALGLFIIVIDFQSSFPLERKGPEKKAFSQQRKRFMPSSTGRKRSMRPQSPRGQFGRRRPMRPYANQSRRRGETKNPLEQDLQRLFEQHIVPISEQFDQILKSSYVEQEITRKKRKREEKVKRSGTQRRGMQAPGRRRMPRRPSSSLGGPWGAPRRQSPFGGFPGRRSPWAGQSDSHRPSWHDKKSRGDDEQNDRLSSFDSSSQLQTSDRGMITPSKNTSDDKGTSIFSSGKSKKRRQKEKKEKEEKKKLEKRKKSREATNQAFKAFSDEASIVQSAYEKSTTNQGRTQALTQLVNRLEGLNEKLSQAQNSLSDLSETEKRVVLDKNKANLTAFSKHLLQALTFFTERYKNNEDFAQQRDHVRRILQTLNGMLGDEAMKGLINGFVNKKYSSRNRTNLLSAQRTNEQRQENVQDLQILTGLLPHESEILATLQADLRSRIAQEEEPPRSPVVETGPEIEVVPEVLEETPPTESDL